ncbi:Transmembrane protein [Entamoeba marina]
MDVSITPLSLYNNKTKIFSSPLLKSFTPLAEKHNLMNEDSIDQNKFKHNFTLATIPYFHISFMNTAIDPSTLPPTHTKDFRINRKHKLFYPMMYHNTFWLIKERYIPMNDTVTDVVVPLQLSTVSYFKWTMMKSFDESFNIHSQMGTLEENETDEFKRIFMETNIVLLVVTMTVTILHSVFDFLAYKNDIQFWNKRDNFAGISIKSVLLSIVIEVIVLLYLLDNDTSFMILISSGIGLLITIWKLTRVFKINFQHDGPLVEYKNKAYEQSNTKLYDDQALKYLGIACIPLCIGYSIYSLYTNEFKSWYSYILSTLVGVVYAFGFLQMTPQLFINYKLKSVANLPWRVFIYKFLNTIVDDLFAFVIKMPTLHRIACFRDDVIFVLYLYQRWIYPVDLNRMDSTHWEDDTPLVKQTKDKED